MRLTKTRGKGYYCSIIAPTASINRLRPRMFSISSSPLAHPRSVYLTVTGTSAEMGDDGQVGRGNRPNGLITPYRPMTLEAAAGRARIWLWWSTMRSRMPPAPRPLGHAVSRLYDRSSSTRGSCR